MAEETGTVGLNSALLERRASGLYTQLAGALDVPPLAEAAGLETALWVMARALAPFEADPPRFNWIYRIQGGTSMVHSNDRPPHPESGLLGVRMFRDLDLDSSDTQRSLVTVGIRGSFGLPLSAEVYAEIGQWAAEGAPPVVSDATRIECGNPLGPVMFVTPFRGNRRPYPHAVPVPATSLGGSATIRAATEMGQILARRLAEHYHLVPVP